MSAGQGLVLDANILIRAALGRRVRSLLETLSMKCKQQRHELHIVATSSKKGISQV